MGQQMVICRLPAAVWGEEGSAALQVSQMVEKLEVVTRSQQQQRHKENDRANN